MSDNLDVTLWLVPGRPAALSAARAIALGATPIGARTYLSRAELRRAGDADSAAFDALEAQFRSGGITHLERSWRRLRVRGSRADCARTVAAALHSSLGAQIAAVFGLEETAPAESYARANRAPAALGVTVLDVGRAYQLPSGLSGRGTSIGIVHPTGTFHPTDLARAMTAAHRPLPTVKQAARAATKRPQDDYEIALDTQVACAIAPGADYILYGGKNDAGGYADAIAQALLDQERAPSIISISYGVPEDAWPPGALLVIEQLFIAAALCGVTIVAASGDHGSDAVERDPQVIFPASSAFALACGGTNLRLENGRRIREIVWNEAGLASGGGFSRKFERPPWQAPDPTAKGRAVPDVAGHAASSNGYRIFFGDGVQLIGGTSAVAPLWAGYTALVNERLGRPCGFFTPLLYRHASSASFHDVTSGSNGRYQARRGWDPCTGLGAPHFGNLLRLLALEN